ncbi:PREDICTED: uncharacterized protein LOC108972421 [Bactrocera latifrons]|uniref:uncharacterized protein LOC108972421 n=1 Tax=Bactrocera latifrons TaxID=174628 RepID=UPI0008DE50F9|nr:PREDICTED: uncharacterized protein LOC108972421 [Bactrocera latifrons]
MLTKNIFLTLLIVACQVLKETQCTKDVQFVHDEDRIIAGEAISSDDIVREFMHPATMEDESDSMTPNFRRILLMLAQYIAMESGPEYIWLKIQKSAPKET